MATYNTENEMWAAISDGFIFGVIEAEWTLLDNRSIEEINDDYTNELVGEDYGYLLEDICYELVGCNSEVQTIFIRITANAKFLIEKMSL